MDWAQGINAALWGGAHINQTMWSLESNAVVPWPGGLIPRGSEHEVLNLYQCLAAADGLSVTHPEVLPPILKSGV